MVRTIFKLAAKKAPSIVFFDEIDAIGQKRYQTESSGDKEVQRTMIELLARLDGFDAREQVSVIFATNRLSHLDPALIRPGRIDRLIEVPLPDKASQIQIWKVHSRNMTLAKDVDVNKIFSDHERMSGADVRSICTEAGMAALRKHKPRSRIEVTMQDFEEAKTMLKKRLKSTPEEGMFL